MAESPLLPEEWKNNNNCNNISTTTTKELLNCVQQETPRVQNEQPQSLSNSYRAERRMATAREPALCRCSSRLAWRIVDAALILSLLVIQGSALNFFLISYDQVNSTYFWFLADLAIVLINMGTLISSYHHVRIKARRKIQPITWGPLPKSAPLDAKTDKLGVLPLAYTAWFVYACFLVARITAIHRAGIAVNHPSAHDVTLTPQLLRFILTMTAAIFFLQVQAYHGAEYGSTQHLTLIGSSFITVLEILDAVDLAFLLLGGTLVAPVGLQATILGFSSLNLLLPTVTLFRLCISDFGERPEPRMLGLAHITIKTIGFDLPALVLRLFIWSQCDNVDVTAFLIKNGIYLYAWLRFTLPDSIKFFRSSCQTNRQPQVPSNGTATLRVSEVAGSSNQRTNVIQLNTISRLAES